MESFLLRSLTDKFINDLRLQKKSDFTVVAYHKDLQQFVGHLTSLEKTDVREVQKEDIQSFVQKLLQDNYTKKSASRKLNSIRTFFKYLKSQEIISHNPSLEVPHPKYSQTPPRILSKLEYHALRDYAKDDIRAYALIETLLQTGVKIGELSNIQLSDIKETSLYVRPYGTSVGREIPLNKSAKKAMSEYIKTRRQGIQSDFLFITRSGKPILIRNIRQVINRCFREVEIDDATVNDLRNTFIAHQLLNGSSIEYIARIVGHRRLSSTERFLHLIKEEVEKKDKIGEL